MVKTIQRDKNLDEQPMIAKILIMLLHIALLEAVLFCNLVQPGFCITFPEEILNILFWQVLTFSMLQALLASTGNFSFREYIEQIMQSLFLLKLPPKKILNFEVRNYFLKSHNFYFLNRIKASP